jgi:hypothetical protein
VGVVRLAREKGRLGLGSAACLELPEGVVRPSLTEPNLLDPAAFRTALAAALERAGVLGATRVALVLPDPVAHLKLLRGAEIPVGRSAEREGMLRLRFKKALPFDVHDARVAWLPLPVSGGEPTLLVAVSYEPVLAQYEEACESLGLHAGLVELSGLALLDAVERARPPGDRLLVNWDAGYVSLLLSRGGVPAAIRILSGDLAATPEQVVREVAHTVRHYRERLGGAGLSSAALRSGLLPPAEALALLAEPLGLAPELVDPWSALGAAGGVLDAAQALTGAVACAAGRAA